MFITLLSAIKCFSSGKESLAKSFAVYCRNSRKYVYGGDCRVMDFAVVIWSPCRYEQVPCSFRTHIWPIHPPPLPPSTSTTSIYPCTTDFQIAYEQMRVSEISKRFEKVLRKVRKITEFCTYGWNAKALKVFGWKGWWIWRNTHTGKRFPETGLQI